MAPLDSIFYLSHKFNENILLFKLVAKWGEFAINRSFISEFINIRLEGIAIFIYYWSKKIICATTACQ